jgi:YggT family protein
MILVLASARTAIANYVSDVIYVYTLLIFVYIITQWLFAFGVRPGYSRVTNAIFTFLRDVCEPFLRIFRRVLPRFGPLDLSPIVAILVLQIINSLVVRNVIHG